MVRHEVIHDEVLDRLERIERERVRVYENPDGEEPLHVYAWHEAEVGLVHLMQGGDLIIVPFEEWGRFVDRCEELYT